MTNERDAADDSLSGAYVLNSLTEEERTAFERRMAASNDLRNEVIELADTAAVLGLATNPVTPPPSLKASILAAAAQLPQLPADSAPPATPPAPAVQTSFPTTSAQAPRPAAAPAPGSAEAKAAVRWFSRPIALVTAAAAAVALLFVGVLLGGLLTGPTPEQQHAAAFAELNAAPDVERTAAPVQGGGTATLVFSESLGRSALVWDELPPLDGDRVYELWYIVDAPEAAGVFEADAASNFRVLDGELQNGAVVAVTVERAGGSAKPTTDPIVVIETAA
jgi:anti-sigma-K factor RskA